MQQMQQMLDEKCPFCRKPVPTEEENIRYRMKRIEANDPIAMCQEGTRSYAKGDYNSAFEYFSKAAKLGDADAHSYLALMYHDGHGVEKDEKKEIYHYEEAAIGGHPSARFNLALIDRKRYGMDRATKHHIIAAGQGHDGSLTWLLENHRRGGFVKKEVLGAALRAHQAAVDATKSPQREEAKKVFITD
jgi:TPR repeat protein